MPSTAYQYDMLAGVAPLEASSGQTVRHRLNRSGGRAVNRAGRAVQPTALRRSVGQTQALAGEPDGSPGPPLQVDDDLFPGCAGRLVVGGHQRSTAMRTWQRSLPPHSAG